MVWACPWPWRLFLGFDADGPLYFFPLVTRFGRWVRVAVGVERSWGSSSSYSLPDIVNVRVTAWLEYVGAQRAYASSGAARLKVGGAL